MIKKKRVAAIITEYWDMSHADVIITKILEGFRMDGYRYTSTIEIVSMYVDHFPDNDLSREITAKHNIPIYDTIANALKCGGSQFDLDGILIIGEHGDYPLNEYDQKLYPRRIFFEECLNVMLEFDRIVPVFSDKMFAIVREDIQWVYDKVKEYQIPFYSTSSINIAPHYPMPFALPNGAPLARTFGFYYGGLEGYAYHALEVMQKNVENRACGESGVRSVMAYEGEAARERLLSKEWYTIYDALGGFINLPDVDTFPASVENPTFMEIEYVDGMQCGLFHGGKDLYDFTSAYQRSEESTPICTRYYLARGKPFMHFGRLVLEIERFIHTGRPPYPIERSYMTASILDALMKSRATHSRIETPYLHIKY